MAPTVREGGRGVKRRGLSHVSLGKLGEGVALAWYLLLGWRPMRRPRREAVQTDLLLRRGTSLMLVEVKTRGRQLPYERLLGAAQRRRLQRQAAWWAARYPALTVRLELAQVTPGWPLVQRYAVPLA